LARLCSLVQAGQLAVALDSSQFQGLGAVPDAVQRLQSGNSSGKVVLQLAESLPAVESAKL
jgi:NADPH-dependent curcumin reductase CurA